jgi:aryl-alcohol dehydrogenase-like predicted oxidoreductase
MHRYPLGHFAVSCIGFGAMQLPGPGVFGPPRDRAEALAVLRRAMDLGVDHIDTAQYYGPGVANELIREALHPYPGTLALVSKVGARRDGSGAGCPTTNPISCGAESRTTCAASAPGSWPPSTCGSSTARAQASGSTASWPP